MKKDELKDEKFIIFFNLFLIPDTFLSNYLKFFFLKINEKKMIHLYPSSFIFFIFFHLKNHLFPSFFSSFYKVEKR